jgi:hypothetical protein
MLQNEAKMLRIVRALLQLSIKLLQLGRDSEHMEAWREPLAVVSEHLYRQRNLLGLRMLRIGERGHP